MNSLWAGMPTGLSDNYSSLVSEEKQELVHQIMYDMNGYINSEQMQELNRVLTRNLKYLNIVDMSEPTGNDIMSNEEYIDEFINCKKLEGRTSKTLYFYKTSIIRVVDDIGKPLLKITTDDLRAWLLDYGKHASNTSVNNYRRNLNSFFNWLSDEEYIVKSPMKRIHRIKEVKKVKKPFTDKEIELLRKGCTTIRDRAIIEFLLSTGCRVTEVVNINIKDIDFDNKELIVFGKGQKERYVYFNEITKEYLLKYLNGRDDDVPDLFVGFRKVDGEYRGLYANAIGTLIRKLGKSVGVDKAHPHRFRRTMATRCIREGMPIEQVRILLGHESIETTKIYCTVEQDEAKDSYMNVFTESDEDIGINTINIDKSKILSDEEYLEFRKDFENTREFTSKDLCSKYNITQSQYVHYRKIFLEELGWSNRASEKNKYYIEKDGVFTIVRRNPDLDKNVTYGSYRSKDIAEFIISELEKVDWDKSKLEQIIEDNHLRYPTGKYIQQRESGSYYIVRTSEGKNVYYGTYPSYDACLPIIEELFLCNWDKNELPRIRGKYSDDFEFNNRNHDVYNFIYKINSQNQYVIKRKEHGKFVQYYSSSNLIDALHERDHLVNANWDYDLWMEQVDEFSYVPELLPEFKVNTREEGKKYIVKTDSGKYKVRAKMSDLGKMQEVGVYDTLGAAQRVSVIVQKHEKNFKAILRELDARNIHRVSIVSEEDRSVHKRGKKYLVEKRIDGRTVIFNSFNTVEEARKYRDMLALSDWKATPVRIYKKDLPKRKRKKFKSKIIDLEKLNKQYICRNGNRWGIFKLFKDRQYSYGYFDSFDEAVEFRDYLMAIHWNVTPLSAIRKDCKNTKLSIDLVDNEWLIRRKIDGEYKVFANFTDYFEAKNYYDDLVGR